MEPAKYLRRFFGSQWTRVFGPAFVVYILLTVGAAAYTGDWNIPLLLALLFGIFLFRIVFIAVYFFLPLWIAIIVIWAGLILFHKKTPKKETPETPTS